MKTAVLVALVVCASISSAVGQGTSATDEELLKVRQALSRQYGEAIANKDAAAMTDHYTADVVYTQLCPESPSAIGREMLKARSAAALKAGLRDYAGTVKTIRLLSDNVATSTGTSTFTLTGSDGVPQKVSGNWVDTLRREGGEWRVSFQAFARVPCAQ